MLRKKTKTNVLILKIGHPKLFLCLQLFSKKIVGSVGWFEKSKRLYCFILMYSIFLYFKFIAL